MTTKAVEEDGERGEGLRGQEGNEARKAVLQSAIRTGS